MCVGVWIWAEIGVLCGVGGLRLCGWGLDEWGSVYKGVMGLEGVDGSLCVVV